MKLYAVKCKVEALGVDDTPSFLDCSTRKFYKKDDIFIIRQDQLDMQSGNSLELICEVKKKSSKKGK